MFDPETNINVDALEAYLNANKDELCEQEEELNIDLSSMLVKGQLDKSMTSTAGSVASEATSAQTTDASRTQTKTQIGGAASSSSGPAMMGGLNSNANE